MEVNEQYGRIKGASWFPLLHRREIILLGQGGIGSWVALLLARIGVNLTTYDMDTYESHNMTGQLVRAQDVGKNKAVAMAEIIGEFSPDAQVTTDGEYKRSSMSNEIVICGFDNMKARRIAFENWRDMVKELPEEERINCFFQDGRLNTEQLQIFNISGNRPDLIERYEKDYLFSDDKVAEADCTFKQTSHTAAMIAGHMVAFLTSWVFNSNKGSSMKTVPFYFEYVTAVNKTTCDDRL